MVDRMKKLRFFGMSLVIHFLVPLCNAKPCDIKADVCEYRFIVAYHLTMMKGNQLLKVVNGKLFPVEVFNTSEASPIPDEEVITMDGHSESRLVIAINGQIPGPAIEAYIGQTVIVHVENQLYSSALTIHWHGLHQIGVPFMDGVPYVTQCPIGPSQSFTYKFNLTQTGTFWYHSHIGSQRTMGLYGAFIIRDRKPMTTEEHIMVISDYNHLWDSDMDYLKAFYGLYVNQKQIEIGRVFDGSGLGLFYYTSGLVNGRGRFYRKAGISNEAPLAKFIVKPGKEYRFRVIAAGALHPFEISIDAHKLIIVASDGSELEPQIADILIVSPGERFDFIIKADQSIENFWIRGKTLEIAKNNTLEAILHYEGASHKEPNSISKICSENDPCMVFNCPFLIYPVGQFRKCVPFSEMNSVSDHPLPPIVPGKWKEIFLNFAYPGEPGNSPSSVNGRNYKQPSVNALYQPNEVDTLCNKEECGTDRICACTYSLELKRNDTIQMILLGMGKGKGDHHPVHIHGHSFAVMKIGYPVLNKTSGEIIAENPDIDCRGDPLKNYCNDATWSNTNWGGDNIPGLKLKKAPLKDTIVIPSGGYAIVRFTADNPGLWLVHCHIAIHSMDGMAMILNESFADVAQAPDYFPLCRSFTSKAISRIPANQVLESKTWFNQIKDPQFQEAIFIFLLSLISILVFIAIILVVILVRKTRLQNT